MDKKLETLEKSFNPYSPGFSIYLRVTKCLHRNGNCFNPYSPGFSIYLENLPPKEEGVMASILIHLDFLSI